MDGVVCMTKLVCGVPVPEYELGEGTIDWGANILDGVKIGRDCVLGYGVEIGRNVVVGDRCHIQGGVYIPEGVTLEDDVLVGPHVVFTNDLFRQHRRVGGVKPETIGTEELPVHKRVVEEWEITPTLVKHHVKIGANASILCGVTIGEYAWVGMGTRVVKDVPPYTVFRERIETCVRRWKQFV